jgi:chorismate synthase
MMKAVNSAVAKELLRDTGSVQIAEVASQAAIQWLAENPIVPNEKQIVEIVKAKRFRFEVQDWVRWGAIEWQRQMFLVPESAEERMEREVEGLLRSYDAIGSAVTIDVSSLFRITREAYLAGVAATAEKK